MSTPSGEVEYCDHVDKKMLQLFLLAKQLHGFKGRLVTSLSESVWCSGKLPKRVHRNDSGVPEAQASNEMFIRR